MHAALSGGQYSLIRIASGLILAALWLARALSAGSGLEMALAGLAVLLAVAMTPGWGAGWFAIGLSACEVAALLVMPDRLHNIHGLVSIEGLNTAMVLMVVPALHAWANLSRGLSTPAPYGSVAMLGRPDPGGGWRSPRGLPIAAWACLCATYLALGLGLAQEPDWRLGQPAVLVKAFGEGLPPGMMRLIAWSMLVIWISFAGLALVKALRPLVWVAALVTAVLAMPWIHASELAFALIPLHLLGFDPKWLDKLSPRPNHPEWVFFDGQCGLCHAAVRMILAEDRGGNRFVMASREGKAARERLTDEQLANLPDSIIVRLHDQSLLTHSAAIIHILDRLGGWWSLAATLLASVPKPMRDGAYRWIAARRREVLPEPEDACPTIEGKASKQLRA